jgi:hypothetical protein
MTETLIADWIKDLKKFQREKIARDSERYLSLSNALCRRVLLDFLGMNAKQVKKQNKLSKYPEERQYLSAFIR